MNTSPDPTLKTIDGEPSWCLASDRVEACVTETGGHLGPVIFDRQGGRFSPFGPPPWVNETIDPGEPALMRVMRGDFFCLPFGGNSTPFQGEKHPPHGETASAEWTFEQLRAEAGKTELQVSLRTRVRAGRVDKFISVRDGHDAVYTRHVLSGMTGPMSFGHHAIVKFPDEPGSGLVAVSPFKIGQVFPEPIEKPPKGSSALKPGAKFDSLGKVPAAAGGDADLSAYPARRGNEDIVIMVSDPALPFAWTAVTFPAQGYVWFGLKNPRVLRQTLFWMSNEGRQYPPWNGRHRSVMGMEEITSYFHPGIAESVAPNPFSEAGFPTSAVLDPKTPFPISYIMAAVPVPKGFDHVAAMKPSGSGVIVRSKSGQEVSATLDLAFLE